MSELIIGRGNCYWTVENHLTAYLPWKPGPIATNSIPSSLSSAKSKQPRPLLASRHFLVRKFVTCTFHFSCFGSRFHSMRETPLFPFNPRFIFLSTNSQHFTNVNTIVASRVGTNEISNISYKLHHVFVIISYGNCWNISQHSGILSRAKYTTHVVSTSNEDIFSLHLSKDTDKFYPDTFDEKSTESFPDDVFVNIFSTT